MEMDSPRPQGLAMRLLTRLPLLLYGIILFSIGIACYLLGVVLVLPRYLLGLDWLLRPVSEWLVWYSGMPIMLSFLLVLVDLLVLLPHKRRPAGLRYQPLPDTRVTVVLTAYNDELSIAAAVRDFLTHANVARVIVVSNNSRDATMARAVEAGAEVHDEPEQGYGRCVHRCLSEAMRFNDTPIIVLCEGDCTFRAYDIDKLLAYLPHADVVNGTRTVEPLRAAVTQLSTFMYYGNLFVGKLLEAKHLGRGTITDVGTTYKACRRDALVALLPDLNPDVNLEFNAHFLDTALERGLVVVECPITFHPRIGLSKGGNTDNGRAFMVGLRMIRGVAFGWASKAAA
jgi:Glycosyl transferase family 2